MRGQLQVSMLAFVLVGAVSTLPQDITFPENQPETCKLLNGEQGNCVHILSCPAVLEKLEDDSPVPCEISKPPMACCPISGGTVTNPLQDISPPAVSFECGRNANSSLRLQKLSIEAHVLRPEAIHQAINENDNADRERPSFRPGIPKKALDEQAKRLANINKTFIAPAIGAVDAVKSAWPWMALLGEELNDGDINWFCGGVLINDQWILTALHCFLRKTADVVRLGEHDYNDAYDKADHKDFSVAETVLFPDYTHPQGYHDLALLRLATKVALTKYISPVCLPWGKEVDTDLIGQKVTLTGWGDTLFGGFPSSILQEVNVTVFPSSTCDKSYSSLRQYSDSWPRGITDEMVCAGDPNGGRDACQGDSGGPIVYLNSDERYTLAGIVSRGYGCGLKDYPGLYVNLHKPNYLAWIKKTAF